MYMHFCSVIVVNKIADLSIDFRLNYALYGLCNRKITGIDKSLLPVA